MKNLANLRKGREFKDISLKTLNKINEKIENTINIGYKILENPNLSQKELQDIAQTNKMLELAEGDVEEEIIEKINKSNPPKNKKVELFNKEFDSYKDN